MVSQTALVGIAAKSSATSAARAASSTAGTTSATSPQSRASAAVSDLPVVSHSKARAAPSGAPREPARSRVGCETDPCEGGHEGGDVRGDPDVARKRQREPTAGSRAVDRCDHRLLERADREHVPVVLRAEPVGEVAGAAAQFTEVLAGTEGATGAGENDSADRRIRGLHERGPQPVVRRSVERVQDVGPVEGDRHHRTLTTDLDRRSFGRPYTAA